ncbi:MAG: aminotransferase class IV [Bacteroidales bacterium]
MTATNLCYLNGEILPYERASLHVSDLQFQRGYGIFDFFRSRNGDIPWLEDYEDRLFRSLELADLEMPVDRTGFRSILSTLQEGNRLDNAGFKVLVTGGFSDNLAGVTGPPNLLILHRPWEKPPDSTFREGVALIRQAYVRPNPEIKSLYYFNTLALRGKLKAYDAVDVLFHDEFISEVSRANLFFVKKDVIVTPDRNILKGITRKQVLGLVPEIRVEPVPVAELDGFEEIFLTSTGRDVTPVVRVEGRPVGDGRPGPVTRDIMRLFREQGW